MSGGRYGIEIYDPCQSIDISEASFVRISSMAIRITGKCQDICIDKVHVHAYNGIEITGRVVEVLRVSNSVFESRNPINIYRRHYYSNENLAVSILVEDSQFYGYNSQGYQAIRLYEENNRESNNCTVTITRCEFQYFDVAFSSQYYNNYHDDVPSHVSITLYDCSFRYNGHAIYTQFYSPRRSNNMSLAMVGNTFVNHTDHVIDIDQAIGEVEVTISHNSFHTNAKSVIRMPNTIQYCNVTNNSFWNNTGRYVINVYEALQTDLVGFYHVIEENSFTENRQYWSGTGCF